MRWSQNKVSVTLISIGTLLIVAAVVLMALVAADVIGNETSGNSDLVTIPGFGEPIKTPTPGPSPTPTNRFPPGSNAPIARLVIPSVEIDAPVVVKGVDNAGVMQAPDNAYDTAWYDFSARPGFGGNAVFSGHVDYIRVGKAVFWDLKDLKADDIIEVQLQDGTIYRYAVKSLLQYDSATAPVDDIVGATPTETITLITCSGTFNSATHQYDKRLVVRAERIDDIALPPPAT
ncbi:MAG: class F sortase [Dehalococcoidia bacterium]